MKLCNKSRSNLDRKNEYSERELRDVLAKTMLLDRVSAMPLKLNSDVGTGSTSLSVGECQLLCLARVLLKNSKVLILDEATASIDPETEAAVKSTIQREFKDCTVLVIVHRLSTITNCNRILVMEEGEVIELDTPGELLANTNSTFARMMAASDASLRT